MKLFSHPFSSYCWKALIAIDELGLEVESVLVEGRDELTRIWPLASIPVLQDDELVLPESTTIVEHLDRDGVLTGSEQARLWDRLVDQHVLTPMQKVVADALRPDDAKDPFGVEEARQALRAAYPVFDAQAAKAEWLAGPAFTIADVAAAPGLHYAFVVEPWSATTFPALTAYHARLQVRPSVQRTIDAARPYREIFPLGWPAHVA